MNPFTYIEQASSTLTQHPSMALVTAVIAGVFSTST